MTKDLAKKNRGRGEVKLVRKTPAKKNERKGIEYNKWTKKAMKDLRNARRCE